MVRKPVKVCPLEPLAGTFPCRHPWLESVTRYHRVYGPTSVRQAGPTSDSHVSSYMDFGWAQVPRTFSKSAFVMIPRAFPRLATITADS